ncbi:MAG: hypothetical protein M0Z80_11805 [Treponema sp.]|nr:hypothetical protein [Treponema sp.]
MAWYADWVRNNVLLSAFVQFALLGTLGEVLGILGARQKAGGGALEWLAKALVWGVLGILIKYAFTGFKGFLQVLVEQGFLPGICESDLVLRAFSLSFLTNAMFGPLLMFLHRSSDNIIAGSRGYRGIDKSLATLAWFWVPAHTVTFSLPIDFQIGLAALWSVALGLIMGFTKRRG